MTHIVHPFEPFCPPGSRILVLGSFPSAASREQGFYYGHPRNRFWHVLAAVYGEGVPEDLAQKQALLTRRNIALWDVILSCDIEGSADASIRNAVPCSLDRSCFAGIQKIYVNGRKAFELYNRYLLVKYGPAVYLPSTSAANAAWSRERLIKAWSVINS